MKAIPNRLFFDYVAERLSDGDNVRLRLKGNSMFPLLRNNKDVVVLAPCAGEKLVPMDVVLFRYRGDYVLHRIVRREGDRLLMQGDGVYASFEQCMVGDVVGRVIAVCRPSGRGRAPRDRALPVSAPGSLPGMELKALVLTGHQQPLPATPAPRSNPTSSHSAFMLFENSPFALTGSLFPAFVLPRLQGQEQSNSLL